MFRFLMAVLISINLIGCTTMKAVERPTPSTANEVIVGDDVRVTTKAGKTYELEVTAVAETSMTGREKTGKLWKVPFDQIQTLEVEKVSAAKSAGLGLAVTVLLGIAAVIATGYALEKAFEDRFNGN